MHGEMLAATLPIALYALGAEAVLRRFNFTVHSDSRSPGMPTIYCPYLHAYSSARIKDLTTMQMDSSERCTSSTASSRAHWLRWMKATMSKYSSRTT